MIIFSSTAGIKFFSCLVQLVIFSRISGYNLDTKFPIFYESSPGNYFGYSVALHRNRDGPMALIGAPRANSSVLGNQLHEPGVIYRCGIANYSVCTEVILDRKGNTQSDRGNDFSYYDKKDNMWLGVSLDIQQNGAQNDIVACGHLWKNQFYRQHYLTNGVCYVIDRELDPNSVTKLVPFVDKSKQSLQSKIYYYAFGQVGTSAAYSEDGKHLLLGAPGFYDWTGTVVSYPLNYTRFYDQYRDPIVPDPPVDQNLSPMSYIGYSITSGKFYDNNEMYAAVGAPRDGDSHGRVYIFKPVKSPSNKLLVHQKKEGTQFGEYFGAVVLGVNLNDDRYTDLLVGAPFSSSDSGGDEGKVYVYISNGMGLQLFAELFGENKPNARFGSAIANIGDLNQDGYNDVAIGAPYEDKNGAVYIYHGSSVGINVQYVQKISASSISPTLSGFGIQISRGLDIDSNQYPDMLVGAYASSNAVLFRAQPVIQLFAKLTFSPKQINMNVTACEFQGENVPCVNVTACLWYAGKHVPLYLEFENDLFVEHPSLTNLVTPRGFFHRNNKAVHSVKQKMNLSIGITECIREVLYIRPDIKDVITPIQLLYRYNLTEPKEMNVGFNKHYPIIDPASPTNITSAITFQTGCGKDDKCLSNLVVKAEIIDKHKLVPVIIGKVSTITIAIKIVNLGEPAYLSELLIYLPPEMPSINQDFCSTLNDQQNQRSNASLICELGNPLKKDSEVKIQIKLDVSKIPTDKKKVDIFLEANTASTEIEPVDNTLNIPIHFKAVADISITGTPSHEQIPYIEEIEPVSISHTYFITNHGPSPLQIIDIILYVPTSFQGKDGLVSFLTFTSLEADSGKPLTIPAKCNDTYLQIKPVTLETKKTQGDVFREDELIAQEGGNNTKINFANKSEREKTDDSNTRPASRSKKSIESKTSSTKKRRDVVINCETAHCIAIQCSASPFSDIRKFARIAVSVQVNLSVLNEVLDPWYRIEFFTKGEVFIRDDKADVQPKNHHPDVTMVKTVIVYPGPPPSEEIAQWIIFVSIGAGILLLIVILILLIKFGFFKRKQKEKMQEMMTQADTKQYEAYDDESNEREALN